MTRWSTILAFVVACGGSSSTGEQRTTPNGQTRAQSPANRPADDGGRCDGSAEDREVSEYDTSGDEYPDVRKVFRTVGSGRLARLVLICREADLNGDGTKDVVRYYNDEGRPLREEADRNFDGQMDEVTVFEHGRIVRQEIDSNGNGKIDTKVFYEDGRPIRAERDLAGRSSGDSWRPDRYEYYEEGRMVRMGTDIDGDSRVDRWDRDADWHRAQEERRRQEEAEAAAEAESEDGEEGGEEEDA